MNWFRTLSVQLYSKFADWKPGQRKEFSPGRKTMGISLNLRLTMAFCLCIYTACAGSESRRMEPLLVEPTGSSNSINANDLRDVQPEAPAGNEVVVYVKVANTRRAVVTVANTSGASVYAAYLPGEKNGFAAYAIFTIQKLEGGKFVDWGENHLGTGLNELKPHERYQNILSVSEKGTYRVTVGYMVDKRLVQRINSLEQLNEADQKLELERLLQIQEKATKWITTDPFDLK